MTITVRYFAALREQRGLSAETLDLSMDTPAAIYGELRRTGAVTLPIELVRFAVNGAYVDSQQPLRDGDELVLIPPVAGG
ncbi:MAG: MoaD/ThiS family protein [Fimbriimonadales bacterium]